MSEAIRLQLEKWGLSVAEADVYLALVRNGVLGASGIASATGIPRTSVYPILDSLIQKGLIDTGAGYGSRFTALSPKNALPSLIVREREELMQRERLTASLVKQLELLGAPAENCAEEELIQVLRDPRAVRERIERLQLEAERQIDVFTKPPYFGRSNPAEQKSLRRGVRVRSLYERAGLDAPEIKPFLSGWIAAGEKARAWNGELPHKLAIFDTEVVVMPLIMPGDQTRTLLIRHPQLAKSLSVAFQFYWDKAEPIKTERRKRGRNGGGIQVDVGKHAEKAGPQGQPALNRAERFTANGRHNKNRVVHKEKK